MIRIEGRHNTALCYTDQLEQTAAAQIQAVCDLEAFAGSRIRIMPDVHAGKGCTIGTTMTISNKIVPGMVGVDIGCGMETVRLRETEMNFSALDAVIRREIPSGFAIRGFPHPLHQEVDLTALRCAEAINLNRAQLSIGTLGGGNHFIEVDQDDNGYLYLVVHSGSRHLGTQAAKYYQDQGWKQLTGRQGVLKAKIDELVSRLRAENREQEISAAIELLKADHRTPDVPQELAWVEGDLFDDYIHDMRIIQHFAALNRKAMVDVIIDQMRLHREEQFTTIHNYIDTDQMILRKGSVSAKAGEQLLIPINMRDGSLICRGKGNPEWNFSAPHGAGRLMSRSAAMKELSMDTFRQTMQGIYTTCIAKETLDESPMAYKPMEEILHQIGPTVDVIRRIRPVYNFKAGEG